MPHLFRLRIGLATAAIAMSGASLGGTASFDDLPNLPAVTAGASLFDANNSSLVYDGITWDSGFSIVGDQYRTGGQGATPPAPVFGVPHSGHYFATNENGGSVTLATNQVLTGAWFGRNEYYGFGGGADQVTIVAVSGGTDLAQVVFDLPANIPGSPYEQAAPLSFVDTSSFASLSGITGYRIDRRAPSQFSVNWVADDFQFSPASAVPVPGTLLLLGAALPGLAAVARRKKNHAPSSGRG